MGLQRFRTTPVFACLVTIVSPAVATAQHVCERLIPAAGAYQILREDGTKRTFSSAKAMYCSDDWTKSSQSSSWGFNVDVPGYGSAEANAQDGSKYATRSTFCSDASKDFSSTDKVSLYRMQGDDVLVRGFVDCVKAITASTVYSVQAESVGDDVTLTITPNLSQNAIERITSVAVLAGATTKPDVAITPGTPLIGKNPVVGGYTLTAPQATLIVRTSTGDQAVSVRRRLDGTSAGMFEVKATTFSDSLVPVGKQLFNLQIPQAGCHPRCQLGAPPDPRRGDVHLTDRKSAPDIVLKNVTFTCAGDGCAYHDHWDIRLLDDHQISIGFRSRSVASSLRVEADGFKKTKVGTETVLQTGTIKYGEQFSIQIPADAAGAYISHKGAILPLDNLVERAPFTVIAKKLPVGNNLVWTLRLDDPTSKR